MRPVAEILVDPDGQTGIRRLAAAGVLGERIVAAHCVKVDAEEIALLAAHDVAVAHCPRSNAFLGCGIAPLSEFLAAGLRVGVGTDGVSSVPVARLLRGAAGGRRGRAGPHRAGRRAVAGRLRSSSRPSAARERWGSRTRSGRSSRESRPISP